MQTIEDAFDLWDKILTLKEPWDFQVQYVDKAVQIVRNRYNEGLPLLDEIVMLHRAAGSCYLPRDCRAILYIIYSFLLSYQPGGWKIAQLNWHRAYYILEMLPDDRRIYTSDADVYQNIYTDIPAKPNGCLSIAEMLHSVAV